MNPIVCCVLAAVACVVTVDAQVYAPDDSHSAVVPDADPVPAPPDTIMPSFEQVESYLAEFKALYNTRAKMLDIYFTLEEDSAEQEAMRIQLRKMTGEMKKIVENMYLMLADMATLRDKKQAVKQEQRR